MYIRGRVAPALHPPVREGHAVKLVITIDTEEDNWRPFSTGIGTRNAQEIARVHDLFMTEGVRPTYLITWPMALDDRLVDTLADENLQGHCEVGTHCHPWTTPPLGDVPRPENSMLCNLPRELVATKITALHELITERFGVAPRTFRAGRWGYGPAVSDALARLNYRVDTSITAYTDWSAQFGPDYSLVGPKAFRFSPPHVFRPMEGGQMTELPATVGFLTGDFSRRARFEHMARKPLIRWSRLIGILDALALHRRITLSPECATTRDMIGLIDSMQRRGFEHINLFFHSPSLLPGLTPYVKTRGDRDDFLQSLRTVIRHARRCGITPILARETVAPAPVVCAEAYAPDVSSS